MIAFECSSCGKPLKVKDELAGKRIRCPQCQQVQEVPVASAGPATVPARRPADSQAKASVPEDATLPPSPRSRSVSEEVTLPPGSSPLPGPTITHPASDHEPADSETSEVVKAGSAYKIGGEIARGGMGAVMRAIDQDIRREVAVKFLLSPDDERLKARFVEEAQITGQLEHPNIVPIHQLGVHEDGRCFFSMKMVKGRSLAELLRGEPGASATGGEYTLGRLLTIFSNICNALAYAHSRGVVHRDLKPANVMVGDFGEVYVMDWGLAKALGSETDATAFSRDPRGSVAAKPEKVATNRAVDSNLTQAGSIIGTPAYMPPEQARGDLAAIDERSDIYSLGAILYEVMTLSPPVGRSGDHLAILMRVMEGAIEPPEKQAPERVRAGWIPAELSAVAMKALALDPADRYPSVEALQRDIQLFLEGRSVSAKRDSGWEMLKKLVKRNKGVSVATAAALVILAVVAGFFLKINYDARVEAEDNYAAFLKEQEEKRLRMKESAPAFLRAAKLTANEKDFKSALAQVGVALESDPELTDGYLLRGQLLIGLERYSEAAEPLAEYLRRKPGDAQASKLAELAAKPEPDKAAYFVALYEIFHEQKALALAGQMTHLAERLRGPLRERLPLYRQRIETVWPGYGPRLQLSEKGELGLSLIGNLPVLDLTPLKDMPLTSLNLAGTKVENLEPLRGMPLHELLMDGCPVRDLGPLRGMGLRHLVLHWCGQVTDLGPLAGMPLERLAMRGCEKVKSLEPLRGMPLVYLAFPDSGVESFEGLQGMKKLKILAAWGGAMGRIKDLSPLRGLPLENLSFNGVNMRDFEPLRGMKLTSLGMTGSGAANLDFLKGMPLTELDLSHCRKLNDLSALAGMKLTELMLRGCREVRDIEALKGMPLQRLDLAGTQVRDIEVLKGMPLLSLNLHGTKVRDLGALHGMKLQELAILECAELQDLGPLDGMELKTIFMTPRLIHKGMDLLRRMKSLETIGVDGPLQLEPAQFWKLYDKGEFKK